MTDQQKLMDTFTQLGQAFNISEVRVSRGSTLVEYVEVVLCPDKGMESQFRFDLDGAYIGHDIWTDY